MSAFFTWAALLVVVAGSLSAAALYLWELRCERREAPASPELPVEASAAITARESTAPLAEEVSFAEE